MRRNRFKDIKLVLFDLDNTLFDHRNSLLKGILAVRSHLGIYAHNIEELASKYNRSLEQAYQKYLNGEISYEEKDRLKIIYYFQSLQMTEPTKAQIQDFVGVYESTYMANRRATSGSVHTLKELRKRGYRLGILTNGQIEDQTIKS